MIPRYFDIHSHIQSPQFFADKEALFNRMEEEGVSALVVGVDRKSSESAIKEAKNKEWLYATVGLHANDVFKEEFDEEHFRLLARNRKVVAIGECGLDNFRTTNKESRIKQKKVFEQHIQLALDFDLPLMLHCRSTAGTTDAYDEMLQVLNSYFLIHNSKLRGNVHFFTGPLSIAKKFLDIGFTLSFTGVLTFARDYDETVRYAPLASIMSETDCPFAAPIPYRGKRNEPTYVNEVVKRIAEIRGENFEIVRAALVSNALRFFNISTLQTKNILK